MPSPRATFPTAATTLRGAYDRRDGDQHGLDLLHREPDLLATARFATYDVGGASTATRAARRMSMSDRESTSARSIESVVIPDQIEDGFIRTD